ncbi:unnamed protein product, partial [marine sediment metagenome]
MDPLDFVLGDKEVVATACTLPPLIPLANPESQCDSPHNRAYTDAFFLYLSSRLLNNYAFPHAIQYYGSFLGIKNDFRFDFSDDISEPWESNSFMEGIDTRFMLDANHLKEGFIRMKQMLEQETAKKPLGQFKVIDNNNAAQLADLGIEEIDTLSEYSLPPPPLAQPTQTQTPLAIEEISPLADIAEILEFPDYETVENILTKDNNNDNIALEGKDEDGDSDRTSVTTA